MFKEITQKYLVCFFYTDKECNFILLVAIGTFSYSCKFITEGGYLKLLTRVRFFSKTGSDTFRSVLIYGKEQESRKSIL